MGEVANILIRLRELGVQAASDTIGPQERKYLDLEFQESLAEIDRIANNTSFNGIPLLNGTSSTFEIQVGTRNNPLIDRIKLFDSNSADINIVSLGLNFSGVSDKASAQSSLGSLDNAISSVTSIRAEFGAMQNRLQSIINGLMVSRENLSTANSRIRDADLAEETTELTKSNILQQSGISVLGQANSSMKQALNLLGGSPG
jgi:flagellin